MTSRQLTAAALALATLTFAPAAMAQDANSNLPPGPGRDVLLRACTTCHDFTTISGTPRTPDGWERVIGQMINSGAELTSDEQAQVYAYVTKNFGLPSAAPGATPVTPPTPPTPPAKAPSR